MKRLIAAIIICLTLPLAPPTGAQESSLFRQGTSTPRSQPTLGQAGPQMAPAPVTQAGPPMPMPGGDVGIASASWTFSPAPQLRTFRLQDIVTIRVDEIARMRADGAIDSRRNGLFDVVLKDWVALRDGNLGKDPQPTGDPRIDGQTNQIYRSNAAIQSRESLAFSVAAKVVDIQPNGNLVLEARKTIWMNDNIWETALSGICRAQDIAPDNIVLSRDLLDLEIRKNETGEVRDGYKRGWLTRWINEFNPF